MGNNMKEYRFTSEGPVHMKNSGHFISEGGGGHDRLGWPWRLAYAPTLVRAATDLDGRSILYQWPLQDWRWSDGKQTGPEGSPETQTPGSVLVNTAMVPICHLGYFLNRDNDKDIHSPKFKENIILPFHKKASTKCKKMIFWKEPSLVI